MIQLLNISEIAVGRVPMAFKRFLLYETNWNNRLTGIKGARGTGKTTLLLQLIRKSGLPTSKAAWFSLDEMYFTNHTLVEAAEKFYNQGGQLLALDEVHKYPDWAREIKILYDRYPDLRIVFTGSSIIDISKQQGDLSRRAIMKELPGLSFREYLQMNGILEFEKFQLAGLLSGKSMRSEFPSDFRPLEHFNVYLHSGYYPFSLEDPEGYFARLRQLVRQIVENDMSSLSGFDIRNARKLLQLLQIIAQQVPFKPNLTKLAEKSGIHRNSLPNYIHYLEEARLLRLLYPSGQSIANLQKPEKIYLDNSNLQYALAADAPEYGSIREAFFLSQVSFRHQVTLPARADFLVDNQFIFEVGGASKGFSQIEGLTNAFVVRDDIDFPIGKALPLWIFGFLY